MRWCRSAPAACTCCSAKSSACWTSRGCIFCLRSSGRRRLASTCWATAMCWTYQTVRAEVTDKSQAWGYQLGSVYIRKVHFRDVGMIHQIEEKVVNRLRQVTSAIRQAGSNQVSVITSSAEREAAIEFAKAAAIRPATLGK